VCSRNLQSYVCYAAHYQHNTITAVYVSAAATVTAITFTFTNTYDNSLTGKFFAANLGALMLLIGQQEGRPARKSSATTIPKSLLLGSSPIRSNSRRKG